VAGRWFRSCYRSSSGWTHLYGVISCVAVSLIMCTGGECRGVLHDRYFKMYGSTFAENVELSDVLKHLNET
jgi:hypothetical protein